MQIKNNNPFRPTMPNQPLQQEGTLTNVTTGANTVNNTANNRVTEDTQTHMLSPIPAQSMQESSIGIKNNSNGTRRSALSSSRTDINKTELTTQATIQKIRNLLKDTIVEVTNIPSGVSYDFTPNNRQAEASFKRATIESGMRAHLKPAFWQRLATYVREDRCGRCNGISALAAELLTPFAQSHGLSLYIAGCKAFEHHVVIVSEEPISLNEKKKTQIDIKDFPSAITVDLWQHNLHRQMGFSDEPQALATTSTSHMYTSGTASELEISCQYN